MSKNKILILKIDFLERITFIVFNPSYTWLQFQMYPNEISIYQHNMNYIIKSVMDNQIKIIKEKVLIQPIYFKKEQKCNLSYNIL